MLALRQENNLPIYLSAIVQFLVSVSWKWFPTGSSRPVVLVSVTGVLFVFLIVRISIAICSNDIQGEKISGYFRLLQRMASVIHSEKGKKKKTNLKAYREITEDNVLNAFTLTLIELKNVCFLHLKKKKICLQNVATSISYTVSSLLGNILCRILRICYSSEWLHSRELSWFIFQGLFL